MIGAMSHQPNILLITVHDLGTYLGCYGWDPALHTPNLDRLASQGVRFENHFCTAPYCSPSRGAIATGKYPHVNGLMGLVNLGWDIPAENAFLPVMLNRAGYSTALLGFQHIAKDPGRLGYDHVGKRGSCACRVVTPMAVEYLEKISKTRDAPFFLEIGFAEVHRPYGSLEQLPAREEELRPLPFLADTPGLRMDMAMFYENIRRMDRAVGDILQTLDRLDLAQHTLVVFTTDHGIAFPRAKATLYDPGIRTALLMRQPEQIQPGTTVDALVSNVDLYATLIELTHGTPPEDGNGRSFLGRLRGETSAGRDMIFAEKNTSHDDIKRCVRTTRYKYIRNYSPGPLLRLPTDISVTATVRDMGMEHLRPRPETELYDLLEDPWEQNNLAGNAGFQAIEAEMAARLDRILEQTNDPVRNGPIPRPRPEAGIVEHIWSPEAMRKRIENEIRIQNEYERLRIRSENQGNV